MDDNLGERVDYFKCLKIVYKSLIKQLTTLLYMKNIVFTNNIHVRQTPAALEYKLYTQNFLDTASDTQPLVYGISLMIR